MYGEDATQDLAKELWKQAFQNPIAYVQRNSILIDQPLYPLTQNTSFLYNNAQTKMYVAGAGVALYLLDIRNMLIENGHMIILVFNTWLCGRVIGVPVRRGELVY
ncbi:hypothetical protein ACJX0J_008728 [Zea mays]